MRSPGEIDRELALLAAVRRLYGGSMRLTDELLDERNSHTASCPDTPPG